MFLGSICFRLSSDSVPDLLPPQSSVALLLDAFVVHFKFQLTMTSFGILCLMRHDGCSAILMFPANIVPHGEAGYHEVAQLFESVGCLFVHMVNGEVNSNRVEILHRDTDMICH